MRKTIGIDFDGVIHKYSKGWQDGKIYDGFMEDSLESIEKLLDNYNVFIFSTRSKHQIKNFFDFLNDAPTSPIIRFKYKIVPFWNGVFWNKEQIVGITNKKLAADVYIDDRAIKFKSWKQVNKEIKKRLI